MGIYVLIKLYFTKNIIIIFLLLPFQKELHSVRQCVSN